MGTESIRLYGLYPTALLLGALLVFANPVAVSAASYCSGTTEYEVDVISGGVEYIYTVDYPTYNGNPDCIMNNGASGDGVKALQTALNHCYKETLTLDGDYGPKTKTAVTDAQKKAGTTADGVYGPNTGSKIEWWCAGVNTGPKCIVVGKVPRG